MTHAAPLPQLPADESQAHWRRLVAKVLKGAPFEQLVGISADGFPIQPVYPPATGNVPRAIRSRPGRWAVSQRVEHPDAVTANALALADLEGGADALTLVYPGAVGDFGFGLSDRSLDHLDAALAGVDLDLISLRLDSPGDGAELALTFSALARRRRLVASRLQIDFGCDPIGLALRSGQPATDASDPAHLAQILRDQGFKGHVFLCDSRPVHAAGGTQAQELAHVLASGVHYLRMLHHGGFGLDDARSQISFLLAADAGQFLTIAKFRALRLLWARVEEACGLIPNPVRLHAETAWRMLTRRDPYVNVLRTTMAVFAAGIGGADIITALPHTAALGLPDAFARRVARNAQLVLLEEAHLGDVDDPAAGAGGIEALTQGLCETAWDLFQAIERAGGIFPALAQGSLQLAIATAAAARAAAIAARTAPLTGTSEFPDLDERPAAVLRPCPRSRTQQIGHLPSERDAEPFEQLRDMADLFAVQHGSPPKIFLANLGPSSGFSARTSFIANAFAAGGIVAVRNAGFAGSDGFTDLEALAAAARESGAQLVCLCGTDAAYSTEAMAACAALAGHFQQIFLAGQPRPELLGHVHPVFAGCDLIAVLRTAFASLNGGLP